MSVKKEMDTIINELRNDEGFRYSWKANIAMCFVDQFRESLEENSDILTYQQLHELANKSADRFLNLLTMRIVDE
jgi:hypothetical protein